MPETRGRSNAVTVKQAKIWCPSVDDEMKKCAQTGLDDGVKQDAITNLMLHHTLLEGGKKELGAFAPDSKLYLLAHGHANMPLFTCNGKSWNAEEIAKMLEKDGLPKTQREIEMLVCHAGESVTTEEAWAELEPLRNKWLQAKNARIYRFFNPTAAAAAQTEAEKKYTAALDKYNAAIKPRHFENAPPNYLLPMAAQLTQALRNRGYSHFMIISYKAPVNQKFHPRLSDPPLGVNGNPKLYYKEPGVYLDVHDDKNPVPATERPHLRAVWM